MKRWSFTDIADQTGRRAVVTGANTGIGFETARALARKGAHVVLACRNLKKAQAAADRIREETPSARVEVEALDLADLESIDPFAKRLSEEPLDVLILNAGVMTPPETKTAQGFELQFGVNHLGHFALTQALLGRVGAAQAGRIVVLSSVAAGQGEISFDDLSFEKRGYAPSAAYSQSKLANQLFARELQRRLTSAGPSVLVTTAHPGWTKTDLARNNRVFDLLSPLFAQKTSEGALPTLRAATDPTAQAADYFGPSGLFQIRGAPKRVPMVKAALNDEVARRLWSVSEELTGFQYSLPA